MKKLTDLIGYKIEKVGLVEDYVHILFTKEISFNVYNKHCFFGGAMESFKGKIIQSIKETDAVVTLEFVGGSSLVIGVKDEDYFGPEAFNISFKTEGTILVWN